MGRVWKGPVNAGRIVLHKKKSEGVFSFPTGKNIKARKIDNRRFTREWTGAVGGPGSHQRKNRGLRGEGDGDLSVSRKEKLSPGGQGCKKAKHSPSLRKRKRPEKTRGGNLAFRYRPGIRMVNEKIPNGRIYDFEEINSAMRRARVACSTRAMRQMTSLC